MLAHCLREFRCLSFPLFFVDLIEHCVFDPRLVIINSLYPDRHMQQRETASTVYIFSTDETRPKLNPNLILI